MMAGSFHRGLNLDIEVVTAHQGVAVEFKEGCLMLPIPLGPEGCTEILLVVRATALLLSARRIVTKPLFQQASNLLMLWKRRAFKERIP